MKNNRVKNRKQMNSLALDSHLHSLLAVNEWVDGSLKGLGGSDDATEPE